MNYFLDTNVKIGYVFCTDPWNDESVKLLENDDIFYYSRCVENEFNKKYIFILKEQKNFFNSLKDELEDLSNDFISLKELKLKSQIIPLKRDFEENKKDKISELLWKVSRPKHEFNDDLRTDVCSVNNLLMYIGKFIRGFERKLIERKNYFELKVIFHNRDEKYMDLNERLLFEVGVHYPDNCIVLDAHDLSLTECINLEFITADGNMINCVNEMIDLLCIDKFHYLNDFVYNS